MKINLDIEDGLYIKLKMLQMLSGLPIEALIKEAIWREVNHAKPLMTEFMEQGFTEEKNNC